jgi:hypothetical protein
MSDNFHVWRVGWFEKSRTIFGKPMPPAPIVFFTYDLLFTGTAGYFGIGFSLNAEVG